MPAPVLVVFVLAVVAAVVLLEVRGENLGRRVAAALLIVGLAASTAFILLDPNRGRDVVTTDSTPAGTASASPTVAASFRPDPTSSLEPTVVRYEAALPAGGYTLFRVTPDGRLLGDRSASFDRPSMAPVDRVEASNGLVHWRTVVGAFAGLSYVPGRSGPFEIREIVRWPDGTTEARLVDPES